MMSNSKHTQECSGADTHRIVDSTSTENLAGRVSPPATLAPDHRDHDVHVVHHVQTQGQALHNQGLNRKEQRQESDACGDEALQRRCLPSVRAGLGERCTISYFRGWTA